MSGDLCLNLLGDCFAVQDRDKVSFAEKFKEVSDGVHVRGLFCQAVMDFHRGHGD